MFILRVTRPDHSLSVTRFRKGYLGNNANFVCAECENRIRYYVKGYQKTLRTNPPISIGKFEILRKICQKI